MDLGPALVTGMSTPGARGSARLGTRGSTSAMWIPLPSVRNFNLSLDPDISLFRLAS